MSSPLGRLKIACHDAVHAAGGKEGAAATAERCPSVAGDWGNLNHRAYPPLDCAFRLDRGAIADGKRPEILHRYAAELGFAAFCLPDLGSGFEDLTEAMIDASAEFGDIACEVREATRDGEIKPKERDRIVAAIDEAMAALARLRAVAASDDSRAPMRPNR